MACGRRRTADSNWTPLFDKQASLAIGSIAIDPNNSNNVWVGTGEGNFSADSYYGAGLFRSTNAGATWFKVGGTTFDGCSISDVVVKPGVSTTIGVAVRGSGVLGPTSCPVTQQGVWVSTNNGSTWTLKAPPPGGLFRPTGATDLAISPADPAKWFAGMANGAVWRSTDSGQTWGPVLIDTNGARVSLAISPSNPKTMVAAVEILPTSSAPGTADLYLSNDEGTNWNNTQIPIPPGLCGPPPGQCWYDLVLTFDPNTNRAFFIGGLPLFREEFTAGSGWTATSVGSSIHADAHALAFDPTGDLWIGHDGGVTTMRWSPLSQIIVGRSEDLPIAEFEPGISGDLKQLVGGTQDNGTLRYTAPSNGTGSSEVTAGSAPATRPTRTRSTPRTSCSRPNGPMTAARPGPSSAQP